MDTAFLTPAEAAERSGFSLHTLRYYEREGILPPVARTSGGRRVFSPDDMEWLEFTRCLRNTGMPISMMKQYAALAVGDELATMPERLALLKAHRVEVERMVEDLEAKQATIRSKIERYERELGLHGSPAKV